MKKIVSFIIIIMLAIRCESVAPLQSLMTIPPVSANEKQAALSWLTKWFDAWELMNKELLLLPHDDAPEMLFFDKENVYTTSKISSPNGQAIEGPALLGESLSWRIDKHNGTMTLPGGQQVPVGLMSFAAPAKDGKGKKFFVMAAPSFWKEAGIKSDELGLDNLLVGVFLHEFAHTRQMEGIGALVEQIEKNNKFEKELTDNIVQDYFKNDSIYVQRFRSETDKFYEAAFATDAKTTISLTKEAIVLYKKRQADYFKQDRSILKQLDDIFLSMEGLGQFMAVAWLLNPKGGNMNFINAVNGFRRGKSQWSQDEGLALFLLLNKIAKPNWEKDVFGRSAVYVIDLLEKTIN